MKKTSKYRLFLSSCFLLWAMVLQGQTINPPFLLPPQNNIVFDSYNNLMNGETQQNRISFDIACSCGGLLGGNPIPDWKVTVSASGDYINQTGQIISLQHTSLQFNDVNDGQMTPPNQDPIPLSTAETILITGAQPLEGGFLQLVNLNYKFNFIVHGGNHLLKQPGNYLTSLLFTLYDGNNMYLDSFTLDNIGFEISSGGGLFDEYSTIVLQNGANNIQFVFNSPSDYLNGLTVSKLLGLKVESTEPHRVFVKTSSSGLISPSTSSTIPVSKFQIEVSLNQSTTGITTESATPLSPTEILLLTNNRNPGLGSLFAETFEYDLEYSLPAGSADQGLGPPATYSTQVYFIIIPQ